MLADDRGRAIAACAATRSRTSPASFDQVLNVPPGARIHSGPRAHPTASARAHGIACSARRRRVISRTGDDDLRGRNRMWRWSSRNRPSRQGSRQTRAASCRSFGFSLARGRQQGDAFAHVQPVRPAPRPQTHRPEADQLPRRRRARLPSRACFAQDRGRAAPAPPRGRTRCGDAARRAIGGDRSLREVVDRGSSHRLRVAQQPPASGSGAGVHAGVVGKRHALVTHDAVLVEDQRGRRPEARRPDRLAARRAPAATLPRARGCGPVRVRRVWPHSRDAREAADDSSARS